MYPGRSAHLGSPSPASLYFLLLLLCLASSTFDAESSRSALHRRFPRRSRSGRIEQHRNLETSRERREAQRVDPASVVPSAHIYIRPHQYVPPYEEHRRKEQKLTPRRKCAIRCVFVYERPQPCPPSYRPPPALPKYRYPDHRRPQLPPIRWPGRKPGKFGTRDTILTWILKTKNESTHNFIIFFFFAVA